MDELVEMLTTGTHPVIVSRVDGSVEKLQESISRGYVLVKFTDTRGGTELGVRLDDATNLGAADFEQATGTVHLEGTLTLNYVKVRCIADIDLTTMEGSGHLQKVAL
ncbi:MAG: hypothetical protein KC418_04385 [Anaerolineales bacterium]|nr:hypothetical protein [Anaerolineales bacterium]MCB8954274.1 MbtH domain protein [Ardenticatenales bacterium]